MPYNVDKELGGDNKKNDKFMESCVKKVMAGGKDKGSAVAICKSTMEKMHKPDGKASVEIYPIILGLRNDGMSYLIEDVEEYLKTLDQE